MKLGLSISRMYLTSFCIGSLFFWYELWLFKELKVAVKPVSTIKISIAWYKNNLTAIVPYLIVGLPRGVRWAFKVVLSSLLPAKALCVITKQKSISSVQIYNLDSMVKQAIAFSITQKP